MDNETRTREVVLSLNVELDIEKHFAVNITNRTEKWTQEQIRQAVADAHEELLNKLKQIPGFKFCGASIRSSEYVQWNSDGDGWSND